VTENKSELPLKGRTFGVNGKDYFYASLSGAVSGAFSLLIEHPWDRIKTLAQVYPNQKSSNIISQIYSENGIRGFYTGGVPNTIRASIKQAYRWPMQFGLNPIYGELLGDKINQQYPRAKKIAVGCTLALFETYIITPLERIKVWLMTNPNKNKKLSHFFNQPISSLEQQKSSLTKELYRGLSAVFYKQLVSWSTFLWADDKFKATAKNITGREQLSYADLLVVGFFVGIVNTSAVMPFDCVKTRLQKIEPESNAKGSFSVFRKMREIYNQDGIKALYAGSKFKIIQSMAQSAVTVQLMYEFEKQFLANQKPVEKQVTTSPK
jgi:hypothetical protein